MPAARCRWWATWPAETLIYRRNGLLDEALAAFRRSQAINPRPLASHGEPQATDRIREVEQQQALGAGDPSRRQH